MKLNDFESHNKIFKILKILRNNEPMGKMLSFKKKLQTIKEGKWFKEGVEL